MKSRICVIGPRRLQQTAFWVGGGYGLSGRRGWDLSNQVCIGVDRDYRLGLGAKIEIKVRVSGFEA